MPTPEYRAVLVSDGEKRSPSPQSLATLYLSWIIFHSLAQSMDNTGSTYLTIHFSFSV